MSGNIRLKLVLYTNDIRFCKFLFNWVSVFVYAIDDLDECKYLLKD